MDVKALAKSKRAHTQHHSKRPHGPHANQKPKTLSDGSNASGSVKKPLGKQVASKSHQSRSLSKLPANWDRYEEEFEDPPVSDGASQPSEVTLPKSKGADYRQLIADAQSQSSLCLDRFPSMDDLMPGEFRQGLGPMLSVRGEGILSWIGGDNFVVEDKTAATHEASFLSLNLHALAEKLANIDLSQRLFIEADLLPPELCTEGLKTSSSVESEQTKIRSSDVATTRSKDFSEKIKITDQNPNRTSVGFTGRIHADPTLPREGSVSPNAVNVDLRQGGKSSQSELPESAEESKLSSALDPQKKASTFEAAAAEEELDVLLDSFSENKNIASPSGTKSNYAYPGLKQEASVPGSSSKTSPVIAGLDDALDNLLDETSTVMSQNFPSQPLIGKSALPVGQSSSSNSGTKSQLLDDFDSWLDTI